MDRTVKMPDKPLEPCIPLRRAQKVLYGNQHGLYEITVSVRKVDRLERLDRLDGVTQYLIDSLE